MFKVISVLLVTLLLALFTSMALAIYLPFDDVNRMFVAGLSVPLLFPFFIVLMLSVQQPKRAMAIYSLCIPVLAVLVMQQLTSVGG